MSIVPNAGEHPAIFGSVSIGTLTGETLYTAPFETSDGTPVAQAQLNAMELVWRALPEVLAQHGPGRFDFVVTQAAGGAVPTPTLWDSGLSSGGLCGAVARKLLKLRQHVYKAQHAPKPALPSVEVVELPLNAIDWEPAAPVDHRQRVLEHLESIQAWEGTSTRTELDRLARRINAWEGRS